MTGYKRVAVVGSGLMGHAIALVHAMAGCEVVLNDLTQDRLDWAQRRIDTLVQELTELDLLDEQSAAATSTRISYDPDLARAVQQTDLVIEAIVEDADDKAKLYDRLSRIMPAHAVLASNTSFLDIFPLVPAALRDRVMIVHWYTPPYLIDLVDVVPGPETPSAITERMVQFLEGIEKRPVVLKKFIPGYVANNVQMAIESEVFRLLDEGVAGVAEIDDAIRYGLAQRLCLMGQFKKIDYTGLEVVRDIHAAGLYVPPVPPTGTPTLDKSISEGALGVMSGRGFYDYTGRNATEMFKRRDKQLASLRSILRNAPEL